MDFLEQFQPISKAIAGFIAGAVVTWLSKKGILINQDALATVLGGLMVGAGVFFAPRNKEVK